MRANAWKGARPCSNDKEKLATNAESDGFLFQMFCSWANFSGRTKQNVGSSGDLLILNTKTNSMADAGLGQDTHY